MAGRRLPPLGPRNGCGAFLRPCEEDIMPKEVLSILDERTHATYEIPIQNGTIRAMDLRQIQSGPGDFGLMTYDPAFMNTASCQSAITFIDGDKGSCL